ncbi:hypothetical protein EYF80_007327 [Liparis tanakae]|uniref:Uncharacterized protein n=1 Tax=Liparis tanakae TaxID=230148 RepID=A0A4Z2IYW7_9TELE|nr:hypothetical protein EYF80_007327 [Liparis tanakae]
MHHQAVRLVQALDDCILERSIQSGNIDLLLIGIIAGPEEVSGHPVYGQPGDGPWVLHLPSQQGGSHGPIQFCNLYLVQIALNPVDVSCYPVHSQALWGGQSILDHHFKTGQG